MQTAKLIKFSDEVCIDSSLYVYETGSLLPFDIKRVFTVISKVGIIRGNHAHKKCSQLLVCVSGEIEVITDNGNQEVAYKLSDMSQGLLIPPGIWASQKYLEQNSVLMVLCDALYDAGDYIHNYDYFKKLYWN
jgi:dTDP-4-dehydrorhamnose 3,5-epimerase-like enzyme